MFNLLDKGYLGIETWTEAGRMIRRQGDAGQLIDIQNQKLREIFRFASREIKYYRECFGDVQIESVEDLCKLPILTREQLRTRFWDFLPANLPASRLSRTSGSTGEPVCLLSDRASKIANSAAVIRTRNAWGLKPLMGTILTLQKYKTETPLSPYWTWLQGIHKTISINPYRDSESEWAATAKLLKGLGNVWVMGITPAVQRLADLLNNNGLPKFDCEAVFTTGSVLEPPVRTLIKNSFDANICDVYACNEAGDVAWQCRHGTYHINMENVVVEIIKEGRPAEPGEVGQVVITNLHRRVMPIIRYANGDWARQSQPGRCECGCALKSLEAIDGRSGEDIILCDGEILGWHRIKSVMNDPRLCEYQIHQKKVGAVTIKVHVENDMACSGLEALIQDRCNTLTGGRLSVGIEWVKGIEPLASGKRKLVVRQMDD